MASSNALCCLSARSRDASAVSAQLAPDYRDAAGNGRSDVEHTLRGYFSAYEILDVTVAAWPLN